ncbi:hypothetical protein LC040_16355 [Bacillus tianshenii]|nr:hypothetical protein LC040_16355 [Bacillus tianshenii]
MSQSGKGIQRGQAITFRIPSDTPDHLIKQLQRLKETERRNFSSKIAEFVLKGVSESLSKERETVTIPMPQQLTKAQRNWLKHEHSEALIGSILHQLLADPIRATALLASLNSNTTDIDEALYLQENIPTPSHIDEEKEEQAEEIQQHSDELEDDLSNFNLDEIKEDLHAAQEEQEDEEDDDDLLGGFLSKMNN